MKQYGESLDDQFSVDLDRVEPIDAGAERLDIKHYIRILRKHKWAITLFSGAITALAAYYAYTATPIYSATSTLLIESQKQTSAVTLEELVGGEGETSDYYQTQFQLLKSRSLAVRVINSLNLWEHPEFAPASELENSDVADNKQTGVIALIPEAINSVVSKIEGALPKSGEGSEQSDAVTISVVAKNSATTNLTDELLTINSPSQEISHSLSSKFAEGKASRERLPERVQNGIIANFMGRLSVEPTRGTKLVRISFESPDPVFAALVANTVGEQYIDSYLDSKMELTTRASSWLSDRLGDLKSQLDDAEERLIAYKQENGLVDVNGSVGRLNEQELLLATTELAEARSDLAGAADVIAAIRAANGRPELLINIAAVQSDALIGDVRMEQGQRQRELDELLNRYGAKHPRVVDARSRLESLSSTMDGHVNRVIGSIEKNYELLQQRVLNIQAKLAQGKQEIMSIGTKRFELDELEREVVTKRDLYNTFYSRITEANSAEGLETANARVSDYAITPSFPIKPNKQLIVALAAMASLIVSALMAFLYEQMDSTIKGLHDVEHKLGLNLLGILPLVKTGMFDNVTKGQPLNLLEIEDKKGTFLESVNTIRTAICFDDASNPRKVIMVTSSVPGEGKSTTSMSLAYSMAQMQRVLLIDADMRRPSIGRSIDLPRNADGLSNLIMGTATASNCIRRGALGGVVDVLPAGPIPDQPLELLSSARFEKIVEKLRDHYDRIIIDSAPTQAVSDALVLSKITDALVYVVKSHDTEVELINRGVQRLRQINAPIAGVVVSQVDIDKITSYGGDYYYQGYYDYYGYNGKSEHTRNKLQLSQLELAEIKNDDRDVDLGLVYEATGSEHPPTATTSRINKANKSKGTKRNAKVRRDDGYRFKDELDIL